MANKEWFISGPNACATVYDRAHIEPVVAALCMATGDDNEDYTATELQAESSHE